MSLTFINTVYLTTPKKIRIQFFQHVGPYDVLLKLVSPNGTVCYMNSGWGLEDYSAPDSATTDVSTSTIPTDGTTGYPINGWYKVYYMYRAFGSGLTLLKGSVTFYFCGDAVPIGDLDISHSCGSSQITAEDITDYVYSCNGVDTSPYSHLASMTIKYPATIPGGAPADVVTAATTAGMSVTVGPNIWTLLWTVQFTNTVTWWITQPDTSRMTIVAQITATESHNVLCLSDCICAALTCISAIYNRWKEATNPLTKEELHTAIEKLSFLMGQLTFAIQCSNEDLIISTCAEITTIVNNTDCNCATGSTTSGVSVEVLPLTGSGSGGSVTYYNNIHVDNYPTVAALAAIGADKDIALDNSGTGNIYKNTSGTWVLQASLNGADGVDGAITYQLVNNTLLAVGTAADLAEKKLGTYTILPEHWGDAGSIYKITAGMLLGVNTNSKTIRVEVTDGVTTLNVADYDINYRINNDNKYIDFILELNKISDTAQLGVLTITGTGLLTNLQRTKAAMTFDLTTAVTVNIYGKNGVAAASDVVLNDFKVEQKLFGLFPIVAQTATGYLVKVELTSAQILALNSAPVLAVAAPGAGKAIVVNECYGGIKTYVSAAYAKFTNIDVWTDTANLPQFTGISFLASTTAFLCKFFSNNSFVYSGDTQIIANKGLYITNITGDPETGDSDFVVYIDYKIVTL